MNFSTKPLSDLCTTALSKGLSFAPTSDTNDFETHIDFQKFFRTLRLKELFHPSATVSPAGSATNGQDNAMVNVIDPDCPDMAPPTPTTTSVGKPTPFRKKSTFIPPRYRNASLDTYCRLVEHDVQAAIKRKREYKVYNNMSKSEREAITELQKDASIIIRPADKGGAIVIQNFSDYDSEIKRQLNDNTFYRKLTSDPTNSFKTTVHEQLQHWLDNGNISKNEYENQIH